MRQVAKLFLRGKRYNETLKNLSLEDRERLDLLIQRVFGMPEMQKCKSIFCRQLAATIKNEYCDPEVAQNEFLIAIMRAGVTILFHQPVKEAVLSDPIQVRKIFTYWAFNYLKQIIRENVIPSVAVVERKKMHGEEVVLEEVKKMLSAQGLSDRYSVMQEADRICILLDTDTCSADVMSVLNVHDGVAGTAKFVELVQKAACTVKVTSSAIIITPLDDVVLTVEQRYRENLKIIGFGDEGEEDGLQDSLEYQIFKEREEEAPVETPVESDRSKAIADLISEDCRDVFLVMSSPPEEFLREFGTEARYDQLSIARFLGQHPSSVKEKLKRIRTDLLQHEIIPSSTKHNHDGERPPSFDDDRNEGYSVGSRWIDHHGIEYLCTEDADGEAVWEMQMDKDAINVVNLVAAF